MLTLFFSGTGNSKYIAKHFSQKMGAECHSIEEEIDFKTIMSDAETIVVCYPIYGSCVPKIMREFVTQNRLLFDQKNLIILSTQLMFSGDGARVFIELLEGVNVNILYAEHFNMPNNICNISILPVGNSKKIVKCVKKAEKKLDSVAENIRNGIVNKRGFNPISKYLGLWIQRKSFSRLEKKAEKDVIITDDCVLCLKCVQICPMKNLEQIEQKIQPKGNCTLCYRCVNACPQKAITVLLHGKIKQQYQGIH